MNVSEENKREVIRLAALKLSQNAIALELGINKAYVNAILKQHKDQLGGIQPIQIGMDLGVKPVNNHFEQPVKPEMSYSNQATAELFFTKKYLEDLEDRFREFKSEYSKKVAEFDKLTKLYNELLIDHNTIERKHQLELEKRDAEVLRNTKSGLAGITDKVLKPLDKILENEKAVEIFVQAASNKIFGVSQGTGTSNAPAVNHPEIEDPQVRHELSELIQCLGAFPKDRLHTLYELMGIFLSKPGVMEQAHQQIISFLNNPTTQEN